MLLLKLAILNIGRNRRRSLITVLGVGVGLAALIFLWAFMDGYQDQQRDNAIRSVTGHVQIHAREFNKKFSPELILPNRAEILTRIKAAPNVLALTERVKSQALVGTSENSRGVVLIGIDTERESQVTELKKFVKEGAFLSSHDNREVLIGAKLAEKIETGVGDKVVVMTQAIDGTLAGFAYHVKGIVRAGNVVIDEFQIYVTLGAARELLGIEDGAHELAISLTGRPAIPGFLRQIRDFLKDDMFDISTWDEIVPEINQWSNWAGAVINLMMTIVMFVIAAGVMNTILMSVFERTKELGVMMAVGTKPSQMILLIFLETFMLELIGVLFGVVAGYLLTFYFGNAGIYFSGFEDAAAASFMSPIVYPDLKFHRVLQSVGILLAITSFLSLYPAWRAGRMEPVKAIYHS